MAFKLNQNSNNVFLLLKKKKNAIKLIAIVHIKGLKKRQLKDIMDVNSIKLDKDGCQIKLKLNKKKN